MRKYNIFNRLKNEFRTFKALKITQFGISDFLYIFAAQIRLCPGMWRNLAACNHTKKC